MKPYQNQKYLTIAVYALIVLILTISIVFFFLNLDFVDRFIGKLLDICAPLIYGAFIAYALNPLMKLYEEKVFRPRKKGRPLSRTLRRGLSVTASLLSVAVFLTLFIAMMVPQLKTSLKDLIDKFPEYIASMESLAHSLAQSNETVAGVVNSALNYLDNLMSRSYELLQEYLPVLTGILQSVATAVLDILLGFVFAVYFLCAKEYIIAQTKKISKALFSEKIYGKIAYFIALTDRTFGKYFIAAGLDSLLVGFITFLLVQFAGMPYAPLIGVVIAITNIIPIFGPFLGAIPCAIILFVCKPSYALTFGIMILIVQQIDGNIIVPRIHGASTGLPPVWIIVSITVMSGLFGFVGMFIGVPCFSVVYTLIKQYVEGRLDRKSFSKDTVSYMSREERKRFVTEDAPKPSLKEKFTKIFKKTKKEKTGSR
ncbi:MAG: AI-2E family transporter [Clostridia bacterium]|nr:AI-2E family transporter [Clostridia bacterium]